jgi:hypothetical protein
MVEKFQVELEGVLAFFTFPAHWRHRLRTTNLGEGWFNHLRRYLSRFPGCRNAQHSEQVLAGISILTSPPTDNVHPPPSVCNAPARFLSAEPFRRVRQNLKAKN